jgi:hypothetical protein
MARFAPDSSLVVLIGDAEAIVYTPGAKTPTKIFKIARKQQKTVYGMRYFLGEVNAAVLADNARLAITVDGSVRIYELDKGKVLYETPAGPLVGLPGNMIVPPMNFAVPSSMADDRILVAYSSGDFRLFDIKAKKEIWRFQPQNKQPGVGGFGGLSGLNAQPFFDSQNEPRAFSAEASFNAPTRDWNYTVKLLDPATGKVLDQFANRGFYKYQMAPDGQHLARIGYERERYTGRQTVEIWKLASAAEK